MRTDSVFFIYCRCHVDRENSVGIATRYELDGPRIESRWGGEIFHTRPDQLWGPTSLLYNEYRAIPGGKTAGTGREGGGVNHPPHLAPRLKKE
jgi:hypothetical protein